ncbi:MAG: sigma 54-interacting transcriptional regulator [Planctomycetes bacterium]|nr:sigma 54-interacting transcriptional regulator [Planctomycetota bacterium]
MANSLGTGLLAALLGAAHGPDAQEGRSVLEVAPAPRTVQVDGDLGEWAGPASLRLDRREQVWREQERGAWRGAGDCSAEFWLSYDAGALYLAGRIRDDSRTVPREGMRWNEADAIELFLDASPGENVRTPEGEVDPRFRADETQIFLMPLHRRRPWGVIDWSQGPRRSGEVVPAGHTFTGVKVACGPVEGDRYAFEAAIPWHNLPGLRAGARELGFQLAIDDHDEGSARYLYMTWTGQNPVDDTRHFGVLRLTGPPPLSEVVAARGIPADLLRSAPYVLWPALGLAIVGLLLWGWAASTRAWPRLRPAGRMLGVVLFVLGVVLPGWVSGARERGHEARLRAVAELLRDELPKTERGSLATYRGAQRDAPLLDLLSGRPIARRTDFGYQSLVQLAADGFGDGPKRYPNWFFQVLPYWVPLRPGQPERFVFPEPLRGRSLVVVLSVPQALSARVGETVARVRLGLRRAGDAGEGTTREWAVDGPFDSASVFNQDRRDMTFLRLPLEGEVDAVSVTVREGEGVQLVGLTVMAGDGDEGQPLHLGQASLFGVESDLRAGYPEEAGLELYPGQSRRVALDPQRARTFARLWVIHRARPSGRSFGDLRTGTRVGEVVAHFRGGQVPPRSFGLEHQVNVFFEAKAANVIDRPPEGSSAEVAFEWEDEEQEKYWNLGQPLDLPGDAVVEAVEFRNQGPYPIRFRSVVFGYERQVAPFDLEDSPLVAAGAPRQVVLRRDLLERVGGVDFTIYRSGRLVRSTLPPEVAAERSNLPKAVQRRLVGDEIATLPPWPDGEALVHERFLPLAGAGWSGAVLAVSLRDEGFAAFVALLQAARLALLLFAAPILLLTFAEALARIRSLHLRLLAVLGAAAVLPLAVLSVVLVRVLEQGHEDGLRRELERAMQTVSERLRGEQERLRETGRNWLAKLVQDVTTYTPQAPASVNLAEKLEPILRGTMATLLPREWSRGFLRYRFQPHQGATSALAPLALYAGEPQWQDFPGPFRNEPGIFLVWGEPMLGVRLEQAIPGLGVATLDLGRGMDLGFLRGLDPGRNVVLADLRGHLLSAAHGTSLEQPELVQGAGGVAMQQARRSVFEDVLDAGVPQVRSHKTEGRDWIGAYDVLRDQQETPRALLGLLEPDPGAAIALPMGQVPVRPFFAAAGSFLLLLSVLIAMVVTTRISRPIERLEQGAQALRRGDLDVRVDSGTRDEIGRLTQTFNQMAQELRTRIQDLGHLNRGIQEIAAHLDLRDVVTSAIGFCARHSLADRVRIVLLDRERDRVEVHGDAVRDVPTGAADLGALLQAEGLAALRLGHPPAPGLILPELFPEQRAALVLPLLSGGRSLGCILLLFAAEVPAEVNAELLSAVASHTASAIENARLYRHAIHDPHTGALLSEPFRRRATQDVARARAEGRSLALLALRLADAPHAIEAVGRERFDRWMERLAGALRRGLPEDLVLGRVQAGEFQFLLRDLDEAGARARLREVVAAVAALEGAAPGTPPPRVLGGCAVFPESAPSAEFLFQAVEEELDQARPARLPAGTDPGARFEDPSMVLGSPAIQQVLRTLEKVAPTDLSILLEGETGTGKEVLTNVIHRLSRRSEGPLIKVHCAAIPETLLQAELFGHEKGAFTGAVARRAGRFEQAHGGTIFLDEIGEIPLEVQVKLLRVLQEKEVDRIGGTAPVAVDVRVIAATNRNLRQMVAQGSFREDLYYRLTGVVVTVPPLRARKQEIPALVELFRREAVAAGDTQVTGFTPDALDVLFRHSWPGNIRELRNVVLRSMVLARGTVVDTEDLQTLLQVPLAGPVEAAPRQETVPGADRAPPPAEAIPAGAAAIPDPVDPSGSRAAASPERPSQGDPLLPRPSTPGPELPQRLRALLDLIRQSETLATADYVERGGVSPRTALRDLADLLERGFIVRIGKRRGARYRLAKSDETRQVQPSG